MTTAKSVFRYLRDCYRDEYGQSLLRNVFQRKYEHRLWHQGEEMMFSLDAPLAPVPQEWAETVAAKAFLYRKEKQLLYSFLFLAAASTDEDEDSAKAVVCAPLLWCPAEIFERDDTRFLRVDPGELHVNDGLLGKLCDQSEELVAALHGLFQVPLAGHCVDEAGSLLARHIDGLNHEACTFYPRLVDEKQLRRVRQKVKAGGPPHLLPAALTMMVPKPTAARGVLTELDALCGEAEPAAALSRLLGMGVSTPAPASPPDNQRSRVLPFSLSDGQTAILQACEREPLTTVIGPPGTGKSFTIAACALDLAARGQSVLITTRMDDGVDVIAEKLAVISGMNDGFVRFGKAGYRAQLKSKLEFIVRGMVKASDHCLDTLEEHHRGNERDLAQIETDLMDACSRQLTWGALLSDETPAVVQKVKQRWRRFLLKRRPPMWRLFQRLETGYARRTDLARDLLRARHELGLAAAYQEHRAVLKQFLSAVRAKQSGLFVSRSADLDWGVLFSVLPIWIGRIGDLHEVLPLQAELFDVAIVDEATLCDMASLLPVAQRAKRLCIVGDPYQLRHLSFLARDRQAAFAKRWGLDAAAFARFDFRTKSAMDLAEGHSDPLFLNEHYRGHPDLIAFSNRTYYNNQLRVMTDKPGIHEQPRLTVIGCDQQVRDQTGANQSEIDQVLALLTDIVARPDVTPMSVGVISPFRKQVDALSEALHKQFPIDVLQRHGVMIGTPYSFQGQERDWMIVSMAVCREDHPAGLRYLERGGVFNVTVTRARRFQTLFCSFPAESLPADAVLRRYLEQTQREAPLRQAAATASGDRFCADVAAAVEPLGIGAQIGVTSAGFLLDMVLTRGTRMLALDLVGYPGAFADFFPIERYQILARAGLTLFPLAYCDWLFHREACIRTLCDYLDITTPAP